MLLSANEILTKTNFSLRTEVMYGCEDPCSTHVKDTFTCTLSGLIGEFSTCPLVELTNKSLQLLSDPN